MANEIRILGAGGHAKVVIEIAELLRYKIVEVFDQDRNVKTILEYPVNHNFQKLSEHQNIFLGLGSNKSRKENLGKFLENPINLIHPSAVISNRVVMGFDNVMMAGSIVNSSTKIGNHCIVNTGASVDHDCVIEDYVHISPRVAVAGNVKVMEGAHLGIGSCVKQNITIGRWSIVGAGAVVVDDVPDYTVVVGNPAKPIKTVTVEVTD